MSSLNLTKISYAIMISIIFYLVSSSASSKTVNSTFFQALKVGDVVVLKDTQDGKYEISLFKNSNLINGYKIQEISSDFLVIRDLPEITDIHIHVTSIKSISVLNIPR